MVGWCLRRRLAYDPGTRPAEKDRTAWPNGPLSGCQAVTENLPYQRVSESCAAAYQGATDRGWEPHTKEAPAIRRRFLDDHASPGEGSGELGLGGADLGFRGLAFDHMPFQATPVL